MKELYELKDMVCDELKEYGKKGEITAGNLEVIDKLSHTLKSLETIIAMEDADGEYSGAYYNDGMYRPMNSTRSSYARGRRNARRDSMGRYSRDGYSRDNEEMVEQLRELMEDAPDDRIRQEIQRLVSKVEKM